MKDREGYMNYKAKTCEFSRKLLSLMSRNFRLLFCFFQFHCFVKEALTQNSVTKDDLGELYKAFVQDLLYFDREYKKLDSDAVLGLRVAEGTVSIA